MVLGRPDPLALARVVRSYGLRMGEDEIAAHAELVSSALRSWDRVEELYERERPVPPVREWHVPEAADNPWNAWCVRTVLNGPSRGPLSGRTLAVSESIAVAGLPMGAGSVALHDYVPAEDATMVTRALAAGATITGTSTCAELDLSSGSDNAATGPVPNPWNPARTAGGPGSGAGVLVATGAVDMALATSSNSSVIPAAACGVVGLKPTFGLVPYTGAFAHEATLDHPGLVARTVSGVADLLAALAGEDGGRDPRQPGGLTVDDYRGALGRQLVGMRVGLLGEGFDVRLGSAEVATAVRAAADVLRELGCVVADVSVPWHRTGAHLWNVILTEGAAAQLVAGSGPGLNNKAHYAPDLVAHLGAAWQREATRSADVMGLLLLAHHMMDNYHGRYYAMAANLVPRVAAAYDAALADHDVLVLPALGMLPPRLPRRGAEITERLVAAFQLVPNMCSPAVSGHPLITVPAGILDGLPVGMAMIGRRFGESTLLRVADAYERAVGGFAAPPARPQA